MLTKCIEKKLDGNYIKKEILGAVPHKTAVVWSPSSHLMSASSRVNWNDQGSKPEWGCLHFNKAIGWLIDRFILMACQPV